MNAAAVESTALAALAYDSTRGILELKFQSRASYRYFGVPAAVHEALLRAPSKGRYFNQVIRGRYRYAQTSQPEQVLAGSV
jgi:hypothetical protein